MSDAHTSVHRVGPVIGIEKGTAAKRTSWGHDGLGGEPSLANQMKDPERPLRQTAVLRPEIRFTTSMIRATTSRM